ncbi:MAG TPA: ATP-binding protein, partial [Steroidobacteraceae bacterium]|nr:ATP-binding protein [Steroidobacteraceae bacterium]
ALRAGEVIRRFRSVVRAQATQRETSDLNDMIREGVALVGTDTRLHDVRIVLDLAPGLPAVDFDRLQMQQVLVNLLRNAIEALDGERPESRDIAVRTRIEAGGKVALEVCDNGPGVDPGISARMFDAFCTTKAAGTGLGLAVSRTIVEAHGGKLGYKPNVPRGACFQVSLPALAGARA